MAYLAGNNEKVLKLVIALEKALGVKDIISMKIDWHISGVPTFTIEKYIDADMIDEIGNNLCKEIESKKFAFVEIKEGGD